MSDYSAALEWVGRQVEDGPLPVAVLGITTSSGVELVEAFGDASTDDHFALFSITKPLVALAVAQAVERGRLALRRPLAEMVPGFGAARGDVVRLEHLLSHTAGITDPALDDSRPLQESLLSAGQDFAAGTRVHYSNIAFQGAAAMYEAATGRPVQAAVEDLASDAGSLTFNASAGRHALIGGERIGFDMAGLAPQRHPAAGAFGTATGLLDIAAELIRLMRPSSGVGGDSGSHRSVRAATLRGMLIPRTLGLAEFLPGPQRRDFGLGWHLRQGSSGLLERGAFGHAGLSGTEWWIYPELDLAFVLLTNLIDAPAYGVDADELNNAVVSGHV